MLKIMIIRHAEKHQHGSHDRGVSEDGRPAHHELTVRGWQRAGALVHLFAPPGGLPDGSRIQTPRSIFASDATRDSPSLRAMHTAGPLAAALGIPVNHAYAEEEEAALAAVVIAAPSPALIVWHHAAIPRLVMEIAGKLPIGLVGAPGGLPTNIPTGVGVGASGTIYFSSDIENAIYKVTKK